MVSFDPETNCVEAFDVSGYMDVFIDEAFYSRCEFLESVKIRFVLKPSKDVETLDNKNYTLSNDLRNTGDRQVGSEHSVPESCERQGDPSVSKVTGGVASSIFKEIRTHQIPTALSLSECEDASLNQEVEIESTSDNGLSENELCHPHFHSHGTNKNVGGSSNTAVTLTTSFAPSVEVSTPVSPVLKREPSDSGSGDEVPVMQILPSEKDDSFTPTDTFSSPSTVAVKSSTSVTFCDTGSIFGNGKSEQNSQSMGSLCSLIIKDKDSSHSNATADRQSSVLKEQYLSKSECMRGYIGDSDLSPPRRDKYVGRATVSGQIQKSQRGKNNACQLKCEFCGKTFASKRAKNAHRLNPNCMVKCISCNTIHSSKGSLFEHYCRVHPSAQDLKEQFGNDFSFVNLKVFMDQKVCPLCMAPLTLSDKGCVKHFDISHFTNQLFLCCVCGQDFSTEHLWNEHCHKEHGQQDTAVDGGIVHHCKRKHVDSPRKTKQQSLVAVKKAKPSLNNEGIQNSVNCTGSEDRSDKKQNSVKSTCSEVINKKSQNPVKRGSIDDSSGGAENDGREYQCKYCKETFSSESQLLTHPRRKIAVKSVCKQCGKVFHDQAGLIVHDKKLHGSGLVYDSASSATSKGLVECPVCQLKVSHLLSHVRNIHTNESLFLCCVCGKGCQSQAEYTRHCDSLHTFKQKGRFHCSLCNTTCDSASDFHRHKVIHSKICNFCGEKFLLLKQLQRHYLEKHDESMHPCSHCDRKFPTITSLKTHEKYMRFRPLQPCPKCGLMLRCMKHHMKTMHPDVDTEVQCNVCGRKVKNEKRLRVHMECHKNDKVSCSVCFKLFKHSRALNKHLRIVHFVEKMHECHICGKKCSMKSNLRIHMRIHSDHKMFPCKSCNQGFNYKASLLSHMRSKHPGVEPTV